MTRPYQPREVAPGAWKGWFRAGWQLTHRRLLARFIFSGVASVITAALLLLCMLLTFQPLLALIFLLSVTPLIGSYLLALGMTIATRSDHLISQQELVSACLSLMPARFAWRMVWRKPNVAILTYFAGTIVWLLILFPRLPELPDPHLGALQAPALGLLAFSTLAGFSVAATTFYTHSILVQRPETQPYGYLHCLLVGASWSVVEALNATTTFKNHRALSRFYLVNALACLSGTQLTLLAFLVGSPILQGSVFVANVIYLNVFSGSLYAAWREMFLGRAENIAADPQQKRVPAGAIPRLQSLAPEITATRCLNSTTATHAAASTEPQRAPMNP